MARPRIGLVPIPIEHDGAHYPSRKALAQHLAAIKGLAVSTWTARLSRFDGDVVRTLTNKATPPIRLIHQGVAFASRKALAQHLAATLGGCPETWSGRLQRAEDNVALAIAPPSRRPTHRRGKDRALSLSRQSDGFRAVSDHGS